MSRAANVRCSDSELIDAWDRGRDLPPWEGALGLLASERPDLDPGALSVGAVECGLIAFRRRMFGDSVEAAAECPACGDNLDLIIDARALAADAPTGSHELEHGEWRIRFRPPTAAAAVRAARCFDSTDASALLLEDAVESAARGDRSFAARELPAVVRRAVEEALEQADPAAVRLIEVFCPSCEQGFTVEFDPASFFMREVDSWAWRTLAEVDALARRYGWSERDILALGARRRQAYLQLAEQ